MAVKIGIPAAIIAILAFTSPALGDTVVKGVKHTFYGYPDNSPSSAAVAYNCGGRDYIAGGCGTYSDPLTFASALGEFDECEIVWDPYTEKYLRMEDECDQCTADWESGIWHIDIWTGSATVNGGETQMECEDALTPSAGHNVVRDGNTGHTPNTGTLFANGKCYTNNVYSNGN